MEAVILAGGPIPPDLARAVGATERALVELDGRPIIEYVLDSLRGVPPITGIVCVAPPQTLAFLPNDVRAIEAGEKLSDNLFRGARAANSERILIVTGDVPLASGRTWMQFLDGAAVNLLEAAYPIVSKEACQAQFPGGKRTFATLRDGQFTGGNAVIMPRAHLDSLEQLVSQAFAARKNPLALARLLGAGFLARALSKRLAVGDVEAKVSSLINLRAGAVKMPDASIAFDIDKPEDLEIAARVLRQRREKSATK